jgi:hypothetical protein
MTATSLRVGSRDGSPVHPFLLLPAPGCHHGG